MLKPVILGLTVLAAAASPSAARASGAFDDANAFEVADFTFRTVKPPTPGAKKRIVFKGPLIFQGDMAPPPPATQKSSHGWFWNEVSPAITAANPGRFSLLAAQVGDRLAGGWGGFGNAANVRAFAASHLPALTAAAKRENLSAAFILAVIAVESAGKTQAKSPKGAQGLMQLMPATARRFSVANPWNASENIAGGARYLDFLLNLFGNDPVLALAGYNAGEGAVAKHKGVPPYAETRDYVPKVLSAFLEIRKLCAIPPADVRDACALYSES